MIYIELMATRVVGYIRVSTEGQADGGVSLDAQRSKLEAYAFACDLDLVTVEVDAGLSAKTMRRPGLQRALESLRRGDAEGLLVAKLDRLTRSVRDLGTLVEDYFSDGFSLLSVGDSIDTRSAAGRLLLNVLASVSQWEREATGERTREALAHVKAQGVLLGAEGSVGVGRTSAMQMVAHGWRASHPRRHGSSHCRVTQCWSHVARHRRARDQRGASHQAWWQVVRLDSAGHHRARRCRS